ncbi:MAG: phage holin, LLH family [Acholeplasmataceae bacterium]|jgi:hypothetical protein|nr:phage holin, LLH family [Acholeplasmataceae bacterium]
MNNTELITTLISVLLTVISIVLGYWSKKNDKVKKYYESFIKVQEQIKILCIDAENNYTKGDQKKKYVVSNINKFLIEQNIKMDDKVIDEIIESIISITKQINK